MSAGLHVTAVRKRVRLSDPVRHWPWLLLCGGIMMPPLAFMLLGCRGQQPPTEPEWGGSEQGQPGETLEFWAVSRDANDGNLSYMFDWGDGSTRAWSAELTAGDTFTQKHIYNDAGRYVVQVRARDETRRESGWSESRAVIAGFAGPITPARPTGALYGYTDTALAFSANADHVRAESVSMQFDWGDTLGNWTGFVPASVAVSDSHVYRTAGNYAVRARARDRAGNTSPWSLPDTVVIGLRPLEPPRNLRLSASAGILVRLTWSTGRNDDSAQYRVWFRPVSSGRFGAVSLVAGTQAIHDPLGQTGEYTVSARLESSEVFGPDTLSTVPIYTDTMMLGELNTSMDAGCGWDSATGIGQLGSMKDTADAALIDAYLTDLTPGYLGPAYYLASPSFGPDDPGNVVPPGPWRSTGLLGILGSPQDPLPEYDSLYYQRLVDVSTFLANVAVHTQDGYYALLTTLGPDLNNGTTQAVSWFQSVRGLRLIQHPEGPRQ